MIRAFVVLTPAAAVRMALAARRDRDEARRKTRALVRFGTWDFETPILVRFVRRAPRAVTQSEWSLRIPVLFRGIGRAEVRVPGADLGVA